MPSIVCAYGLSAMKCKVFVFGIMQGTWRISNKLLGLLSWNILELDNLVALMTLANIHIGLANIEVLERRIFEEQGFFVFPFHDTCVDVRQPCISQMFGICTVALGLLILPKCEASVRLAQT